MKLVALKVLLEREINPSFVSAHWHIWRLSAKEFIIVNPYRILRDSTLSPKVNNCNSSCRLNWFKWSCNCVVVVVASTQFYSRDAPISPLKAQINSRSFFSFSLKQLVVCLQPVESSSVTHISTLLDWSALARIALLLCCPIRAIAWIAVMSEQVSKSCSIISSSNKFNCQFHLLCFHSCEMATQQWRAKSCKH